MVRKFIIAFIMFFSFYSQPPVFAEIIDRSVAFVNNEVITLSEVNELGESLLERITRQAPPEQLQNALQQARMAVIEQIIDKKLLRREADKYNITVSEREIDNAIENIIARNKTSREELIKEINRMEISEEKYKEDLHDQILQSKLVNIAVHSKVVVTEEEIADYYNTNFAKEIGDGGYHILQIGVSYNHDQNSGSGENGGATAKEKIEQIRKQAMAGADFRKLAGEHSDLPSSAYGGDIGVFQKKEMAPFMDKAVSELEPGGISEIVETETGLQIFKLVSRQNGQSTSKIPLATVKEDIRETLYQQKSSELYENWIKDIRQQAYIRIL